MQRALAHYVNYVSGSMPSMAQTKAKLAKVGIEVLGAEEMAQQLVALAVPPENVGPIPRTHVALNNCL